MTTKTTPQGGAPSAATIKLQRAAGYMTVAAARELVKKKTGRVVSLDAGWRWGRKWAGDVLGGKARAYRDGGRNVWLLRAAVEEQIAKMKGGRP